MMLDLESVRLFVIASETGNLTRAAESAGTVQPVVSQRLKSLEKAIGCTLLERTPRFVRLTAEGAIFLEKAKALLKAHEDAFSLKSGADDRVAIGISDHALGGATESALIALREQLPPTVVIDVRVETSFSVRQAYDEGRLDVALIRREAASREGEVLGLDPLGWRAGPGFGLEGPDRAIPLALLAPPCGVRAIAEQALERAGVPWREAFLGGSCAALLSVMRAGVAIGPMGALASSGLPDRGADFGLPELPISQIVLLGRSRSSHVATSLRVIAAEVRSRLASPPGR